MTKSMPIGTSGHVAHVRRVPRARRMTLRVSSLDRRITLSLPPGVALSEARSFLDEKSDWVARALAKTPPAAPVALQTMLPVEGVGRLILPGEDGRVSLSDTAIHVPERNSARRLEAFLKLRARDRLSEAADGYAAKLNRKIAAITLRDPRSRWGSCTSEARVMFSWRLIMAPPRVLDYVAVHEVAHLVHMNHSQAFWSLVDDLFGNHREERLWLKTKGTALHRYQFTD